MNTSSDITRTTRTISALQNSWVAWPVGTWHDIRVDGFLDLGPIRITTSRRHQRAMRNAVEIGRDYERGQQRKARS